MKHAFKTFFVSAILLGAYSGSASADTLSDIRSAGAMKCGVNTQMMGFSAPNNAGEWTGFDVDFCRAIAAAVFGDPSKVEYVPLGIKDRFTALQSGEIDVLARSTTWTISRNTALGFNFSGVTYYGGQGFMVNLKKGAQRQVGK